MADITKEDVIEFIANMTVLDLADMIKEMEEKFGVSCRGSDGDGRCCRRMPEEEKRLPKNKPNLTLS